MLFIWGCLLSFPPRCFCPLVYLVLLLSSDDLVVHSGVRVEMIKLIELWAHEWGLVTESFTGIICLDQFLYFQSFRIGMVRFPRAGILCPAWKAVFWGWGWWAGVREGRDLEIHPANSKPSISSPATIPSVYGPETFLLILARWLISGLLPWCKREYLQGKGFYGNSTNCQGTEFSHRAPKHSSPLWP